jgi:hypothetical protein
VKDLARGEVGRDLPLDALQRVVHRLRVAGEALGDLLVGATVEVAGEDLALELGQHRLEALDEAAQLLGRDHLRGRVLDARAREDLLQGRLAFAAGGRRGREADRLVQRRMLVAARGLDRRDHLPGDAELREVAEARLAVGPKVADRLVEADQPFLDEVVRLPAEQEVRRRLEADETSIAPDDPVIGDAVTPLRLGDEVGVVELPGCLSAARLLGRRGDPRELLGHCCHVLSSNWGAVAPYLPRRLNLQMTSGAFEP